MAQDYADKILATWAGMAVSAAYTLKRDLGRAIEHGEMRWRGQLAGGQSHRPTHPRLGIVPRGKNKRRHRDIHGPPQMFRAAGVRDDGDSLSPYTSLKATGWQGSTTKGGRLQKRFSRLQSPAERGMKSGMLTSSWAKSQLETDPAQAATHFEKSICHFSRDQGRERSGPGLCGLWPAPQTAREHGAGP